MPSMADARFGSKAPHPTKIPRMEAQWGSGGEKAKVAWRNNSASQSLGPK